MDNPELPKNTPISLLEDIPSLAVSYILIPAGSKGYIVDYERHTVDNEIVGYYANIYGVYFEEYIYLDPWEFEVIRKWESWFNKLNLDPDDFDDDAIW